MQRDGTAPSVGKTRWTVAAVRERLTTDRRTAEQAKDTLDVLTERGNEGSLSVHGPDEKDHTLPPELASVIQKVIAVMAQGGTVTVTSTPQEVSTTTAAGILGVSRPTVMKMIREGRLPAHMVGTHHRIASTDVYAVLDSRRARERAALEKLLDVPG